MSFREGDCNKVIVKPFYRVFYHSVERIYDVWKQLWQPIIKFIFSYIRHWPFYFVCPRQSTHWVLPRRRDLQLIQFICPNVPLSVLTGRPSSSNNIQTNNVLIFAEVNSFVYSCRSSENYWWLANYVKWFFFLPSGTYCVSCVRASSYRGTSLVDTGR